MAAILTAGNRAISDSVEKAARTFKMGVSVGWRYTFGSGHRALRDVAIDPVTRNVQLDNVDNNAVVLSGVLSAFPWGRNAKTKRAKNWSWLGFVANIDFASFGTETTSAFNKSIEGGGGIAMRMHDDFALALTLERVLDRSLRRNIKAGEPLVVDGDTLTTLSRADNRFFHDDNLTAISLKFLYFLR